MSQNYGKSIQEINQILNKSSNDFFHRNANVPICPQNQYLSTNARSAQILMDRHTTIKNRLDPNKYSPMNPRNFV
jgi:hypothetical protein